MFLGGAQSFIGDLIDSWPGGSQSFLEGSIFSVRPDSFLEELKVSWGTSIFSGGPNGFLEELKVFWGTLMFSGQPDGFMAEHKLSCGTL